VNLIRVVLINGGQNFNLNKAVMRVESCNVLVLHHLSRIKRYVILQENGQEIRETVEEITINTRCNRCHV
jgi:hypothetical protein